MAYEIRVLTSSPSGLESDLNRQTAEGWKLVSCWPEGDGVRSVLQRQKGSPPDEPCGKTAAVTSPAPQGKDLLDLVLAECKAIPASIRPTGKPAPHQCSLADLAGKHGWNPADLASNLAAAGVKEKAVTPAKDFVHSGAFIWTKDGTVFAQVFQPRSSL